MKNYSFLFIALLLLCSGCTFYAVDAQEILFNASNQEENIDSIQYLEKITVPFEVIGHVTVNTERRNSMEEVIEKMKHQVMILGGDAITNIIQTDKPSSFTHVRTIYTGTVIIFKNKLDKTTTGQVSEKNNTDENLK